MPSLRTTNTDFTNNSYQHFLRIAVTNVTNNTPAWCVNAQRVHTMHILYAESLSVNVGPCRKRLYAYRNTYELHKKHAMILRVKTHGLNCKTTRFNGKSIRSACSIGKHAFFEGKPLNLHVPTVNLHFPTVNPHGPMVNLLYRCSNGNPRRSDGINQKFQR